MLVFLFFLTNWRFSMKTFAFLNNGYLIVTVLFLLFNIFSDEINKITRNLSIKLAPNANLSPTTTKTTWQSYTLASIIAVIPYFNVVVFCVILLLMASSLVFIRNTGIKIDKIKEKINEHQNRIDKLHHEIEADLT